MKAVDSDSAWAIEAARGKLEATLPRRWAHVQGVIYLAEDIAPAFEPEGALLVSAAALHDVGWAPDLDRTGFPALDGAGFIESLGASDRLVALAVNYLAAAVEADVRGREEEMSRYPDEETLVRDALWYADARVGPDGSRVGVDERFEEIRSRYADHPVVRGWLPRAEPAVRQAVERVELALAEAGVDPG